MKTAGSTLATHIVGETTTLATCWKVTRRDGAVFGFTDFDKDLTVDSLLYQARSGYTRSAIHTIANLAVDNLDIESAIDSETLSAADLRAGVWDGATVEIFLVNWANLANGKIILKRGTIGEVELKDTVFRAELRGLSQALSQQIVELYTPDCRADLGDSRCKINLAALTVTGTDHRRHRQARLYRYIARRSCQLLERRFADLVERRKRRSQNGSEGFRQRRRLHAVSAYAKHVAVGDNYSLRPGCDKKFSTCKDRYNNVKNFRGEPNVPGNDQVLAYPDGK
jgi:uncharacterized phage protein (TIGR02218 family)